MAVQQVTIRLSDSLYHQVKQRARRAQRSIEDEVAAVVEVALPVLDDLPLAVADELAQMALMTDAELRQAAYLKMTASENQRMQKLVLQRQRDGLSAEQEVEAERLARRQERVMLVRAQAVALLQEHGHDVSDLIGPP